MTTSSTRIDRYAAMAACGSGALGLAASPLHGDVYHDENSVTISIPWNDGSKADTMYFTTHVFSGENVQWYLGGIAFASHFSISTYGSSDQIVWSGWSQSYYVSQFWVMSSVNFAVASRAQAIDSNFDFNSSGTFFWNYRFGYTGDFWFSISGSSITSVWSSFSSTSSGSMALGERAFFGLELENSSGDTVYGWADISLSADGSSLTVHSWAYDDTGGMLPAGQVPGLGGLAVLAGGAAGMRRKRSRVA